MRAERKPQFTWENVGFTGEIPEKAAFFRQVTHGIGRYIRRAAPVLKKVARVAAPIVGRTVGESPGAKLGSIRSGRLPAPKARTARVDAAAVRWKPFEAVEPVVRPLSEQQVLAEYLAAIASRAGTTEEAEAMAGAATATALWGEDRALRRVIPNLVRGTGVLTGILRRRRITRPAIRALPAIVRGTVEVLRKSDDRGITARSAGLAMKAETQRVLGNPEELFGALYANVWAANRNVPRRPSPPGKD